MTGLVWGQDDQRHYEAGVYRGVFYPLEGAGVAWNGLVSAEESFDGGDLNSYYFDGIKYQDIVSTKNFQVTLTAFAYPDAFSPCIGELSVVPGFIVTRQPRAQFGLSYRIRLDDDLGYKVHLVYNALASPTSKGYSSIDSSASAKSFAWNITTTPAARGQYRPSAHFILDSTKINPDAFAQIKIILYGSDTTDPRLPTQEELFDIVGVYWAPEIIVPNTTTGLDSLTAGSGDLYKTSGDGILRALPHTRLYETSTSGVYGLG